MTSYFAFTCTWWVWFNVQATPIKPLIIFTANTHTHTLFIQSTQLHVLGYSLHSILKGLSSTSSSSSSPSPSLATSSPVSLKSGDLDACLDLISSILVEDLFGVPAEERESRENVAKIPESKTPQSHNCYEIVAQFLSPRLIPDLLAPVREVRVHIHVHTSCDVYNIKFHVLKQ